MQALAVDGPRLWETVMASARIGPGRTPTGLRRLALSDADREMRDLFARWCRDAGLSVTVDRMGNMFARRPGTDDALPPVLIGSHLDTQIAGGRLRRHPRRAGGPRDRPHAERCGRAHAAADRDRELDERRGRALRAADAGLGRLGRRPHARVGACPRRRRRTHRGRRARAHRLRGHDAGRWPPRRRLLRAAHRAGPLLDDKGIPVGVVSGTYGVRGMAIEVRGETAHSGPTPMAARRNALVGAAMLIVAVNEIGFAAAPDGKATTSRIEVWPNLTGILPDWAKVMVDVRHPDAATVERMVGDVRRAMRDCADRAQVEMDIVETWQFGSERFDSELVSLIRRTAERLGAPSLDLPSQAGHDAYYVSRVAPTAMIFTPCERGISHNENEHTRLEDALPGVNVLLHAVLERANR
jgi:beta-ureidopropionase / N-carbamoyl-L-amino-acid hydrolase